MRAIRLMIIAGIGIALAACSVTPGSPTAGVASKTSSRLTVTTPTLATSATVPQAAVCLGGIVTLPFQGPGGPASACVKVGATLVMTGGGSDTGGTWPGPPSISNRLVLAVMSSQGGTEFKARFKAIGVGTSSIEVPFVNGPDVCQPTPCTPIPGTPLDLEVRVVS